MSLNSVRRPVISLLRQFQESKFCQAVSELCKNLVAGFRHDPEFGVFSMGVTGIMVFEIASAVGMEIVGLALSNPLIIGLGAVAGVVSTKGIENCCEAISLILDEGKYVRRNQLTM